ncbi:hypothetical protein BJG93_36545 (plasmid) [Paraburkholderia sprentiae WSM5005]|uniref:Uncharacterized protein n=1 Tax=Paraburkholderia sprentiae WSM5005 TaxID=754502 RepID=A0A8F4KIL6_9BURK|nr:hypothetical protein [Paraburkholderia sprentiae]QXE07370.1 hypothetical protein BJG93_36545 [Paraburkholderia sprentiae WSM5005]
MTLFVVLLVLAGPVLAIVGQVLGFAIALPIVGLFLILKALAREILSAFRQSHV